VVEVGLVILIVFAVAALLFAGWLISLYNGLVGLRVQVQNAWSQIDVQLKRRYDLIPNLVETVKGYAAHERETLERVIQARNMAVSARGVGEQAQAENMLTGALKSLFALSEAYPDLKANENFMALQEELTSTENRIGMARQQYNDVVAHYNASQQEFPANTIASRFGFKPADFFELDAAEEAAVRTAPAVRF
jgi:LemA protein